MNIITHILQKIGIILVSAIIFIPCLVEATPINKTEMFTKFSSDNFLSFEVNDKVLNQEIKLSIIFTDGFFGGIKRFKKFIPRFYPFVPLSIPPNTDGNQNCDSPDNYCSYDWCFYWISLLFALMVSVGHLIKYMIESNTRNQKTSYSKVFCIISLPKGSLWRRSTDHLSFLVDLWFANPSVSCNPL